MTTLEKDILQSAQQAITSSIRETLTKYDSPMVKLVKQVVEENNAELKKLISESFQTVIRTDEFKASIVSAFSHKVARTIISNNDGLFDKVSNELKQDSVFKAKMAVAVSNVVEECLTERSKK
jgi:C4-type Zn-finger protein